MDFLLRVNGRYVCWHSHWRQWYLGPKRPSEWFSADLHGSPGYDGACAGEARIFFPTAVRIWRNYDR